MPANSEAASSLEATAQAIVQKSSVQHSIKSTLWGGGGKAGSICHFAFSLVLQCLGVHAGKNDTKSVIVTPLLVCPKC